MRTYDAIECISKKCIEDGFCEGIILKGSIGRGDDDEHSDVDMYMIAKEKEVEKILSKREEYLKAYGNIIYKSEVNFGLPQMIAIYDNGLHVDLYVGTKEEVGTLDPIKVWYDPNHIFDYYEPTRGDMDESLLTHYFNEALYYFVEGDSAYQRKNYPWTRSILDGTVTVTAILLRYHYDKKYAFLGLKKINEILPKDEYILLEKAGEAYGIGDFASGNEYIIKALDIVVSRCSVEVRVKLNITMFEWLKDNLKDTLFR